MTFHLSSLFAVLLVFISLIFHGSSSPLSVNRHTVSLNPARRLLQRANPPPNPDDQSWIKNWAAVGDSYAAGIGAGTRMNGWGDYFCSRYNESFPMLINADSRLGDPAGRTFNFWACSGAVTADITKQASSLADGSQDVITISSGGNDALLTDILNECVFGWNAHSTPTYSACPPKLQAAQDVIDSDDFHSKLDSLLTTAKSKLNSGGRIYYMGYAQFFGEGDKQCDSVTWSFWFNYGKRQYLTLDRRQQMNTLVKNMNSAIQDAVKRAGDGVIYVDYDKYFQQTVGRFCEDGYPETQSNRKGLILYEYYTDDNAAPGTLVANNTQLSRSGDLVMNGTFEGTINAWVKQAMSNNTNLTPSVPEGALETGIAVASINATQDQLAIGYTSSVLPDSYGRIFHPRPGGHSMIADLVLYYMEVEQAKKLSVPVPVEEVTGGTCPAGSNVGNTTTTSPPTTSPTPTPTASACVGNQIQGSCTQASLPSTTADSGPLAPVCDKVDSGSPNSFLRINDAAAQKAASDYCGALAQQKVVLDAQSTSPKPYIVSGAAENNGDLAVTVLYDVDSCPKDGSTQTLDFTKLSSDECYANLYTAISAFCSQDSTWGDYDANHTLEGGVVGNDCGLWSLTGQQAS